MAELRVREFGCFFCNDLAHDLSYPVFLGPVYPAVAESYDVDSCEIVVDCSTGENPVDTSTSSSDKASEIDRGVLVALEDRISSVACYGGFEEVEFDGLVGEIISNIVKRRFYDSADKLLRILARYSGNVLFSKVGGGVYGVPFFRPPLIPHFLGGL